ncbi:MAG: hypothetical protein M1813_008577 [Trichoglossum hirsutum]|nr:MAG: hypothetical protein M1813_008577 [Trichoglossum hirsutum]
MLAAFLSSDHNFMVYRGFNYLHARCLLYQQDELVALERELDEMDREDDSKGKMEREKRSLKSRDLDNARAGQPRKTLLKEIKDKLSEYDEFISKAKNIASLQQPSKRDYQSVRRWFKNQQPLVDEEQDFIRCKEDLITLRHGRECAGFDGLIERIVQKMNCRFIKYIFCTPELNAKTKDKAVHYFSPRRLDILVSLLITLAIVVLLVLPVVAMFKLSCLRSQKSSVTSLGVLMVFTLLFSAVMSVLTKARRHEIFAASAA